MTDHDPRFDEQAEPGLRTPPHSVEAEQSVLGSLLLDNQSWDRAADLLTDTDFYRHEHRLIYSAIAALVNASKPADVITVFEQLIGMGRAGDCGGLAYLNALAQSVPSAANIRRYAEIVRERAILRKLISAGDKIATDAFNHQGQAAREIVAKAAEHVSQISDATSRAQSGDQSASELAGPMIDRITEQFERGGQEVTGLRTGFYDLDRMTSGLQKGDLIVLAARPSMGKTALALNIAEHAAVAEGMLVLVFSMEMGSAQLMLRLFSSVGRINQRRLRSGQLHDEDWTRLTEATEHLSRAPIRIDATTGLTMSSLRARARDVARRHGGTVGLIVVDYLQLMSGPDSSSRGDNRATELGAISRGLKALANELQCPVIALSQLSRGVENRNDKRPLMSDLRDSGAIEQDADVIAFIYRDEYYNKHSKEPGVAELIVAKQRNGPVGMVKLRFTEHLTKFENLAPSAGGQDGWQ